jgi:hypothetical protein
MQAGRRDGYFKVYPLTIEYEQGRGSADSEAMPTLRNNQLLLDWEKVCKRISDE